MADYFTSFSCLFDVKTAANVTRGKAILTEVERDLAQEEDGAALGFAMQPDEGAGSGVLCLHSEETASRNTSSPSSSAARRLSDWQVIGASTGRSLALARGRAGSGVVVMSSTLRRV